MESTTIYRENAAEQISEQLKPLLSRDIVLLCIGTENVKIGRASCRERV